jgi:hypothetical protein
MVDRDGLVAGIAPAVARGNEGDDPHQRCFLRPGEPSLMTHARAGYPMEVSPISGPSYNEHYSGSYVGGGNLFHGHGRGVCEGTFGWDYTPFRPLSRKIFLGYSHGRRYQGGIGAYKVHGPHVLEGIEEALHPGREVESVPRP